MLQFKQLKADFISRELNIEDQKRPISLPILKACFEVTRSFVPNVLLTTINKSKVIQLVLGYPACLRDMHFLIWYQLYPDVKGV